MPAAKKTSLNAKCLPFPKITSLGAVQRAQRHVSDSITTLRLEPDPVTWTPRSTKSVIHGRLVRSLATNRNRPAVGNAVSLIAMASAALVLTWRASAARIRLA